MIVAVIGPRAIDRLLPPLDESDFKLIRLWGFGAVQLDIVWHGMEPTQGQYSQTYIDRLMQAASLASNEGLQVIPAIVFHKVYAWPSMEKIWSGEIEADFYRLWQKLADLFRGYPVPWYHTLNEPRPYTEMDGHWGEMPQIREPYERAWTRIARNVADIVSPTPTFVTRGPFAGAQWYCIEPSYWTPPPRAIQYMGGYWPQEVPVGRQPWTGDEQDLIDNWQCALDAGVTAVHEIGLSAPPGEDVDPSRLRWLDTSLKLFNERGISWGVYVYSRYPDGAGNRWSLKRADGSLHPATQTVLNNIPTPTSPFWNTLALASGSAPLAVVVGTVISEELRKLGVMP